jgi:hypothetical protein
MRELLSNEKRWTQGAGARDEMGNTVTPTSERAVSFCLMGAHWRCYPHPTTEERATRAALRAALDDDVVDWNDSPGRNFGHVKALLERLNI